MGQQLVNAEQIPPALYSAEQVRAMDRYAIERLGVSGYGLMRKAARFALDSLLDVWPTAGRIVVCCGTGNNGGDGYALAAMAANKGLSVAITVIGDTSKIKGDARLAYDWALESRCEWLPLAELSLSHDDVIVDAMLGTGQNAAPRPEFADAIRIINEAAAPVVAIDVPTGLCADTGCCLGDAAVLAARTVTFIGLKRGLFSNDGPAYAGTVVFSSLGVPAEAVAAQRTSVSLLDIDGYKSQLPPRWANSHKGHFGHVLLVGGNYGFGGSIQLAARAAVRAGAGLVSVATRAEHIAPILGVQAEIMAHAVNSEVDLAPLLAAATVIVVGPGLGRDDWAVQLLSACLASGLPLVIDADGLNLIADEGVVLNGSSHAVLTPHPGEAARLLGCDTAAVQANRFSAAAALAQKYGVVSVLKGAGTVVAGAGRQTVIPTGNAGMAAGGSGDVLSGIIGALIAQQYSLEDAATLGVFAHGWAGDLAAQNGQRGMAASDIIECLRESVNP